jgi:hypothetical protein
MNDGAGSERGSEGRETGFAAPEFAAEIRDDDQFPIGDRAGELEIEIIANPQVAWSERRITNPTFEADGLHGDRAIAGTDDEIGRERQIELIARDKAPLRCASTGRLGGNERQLQQSGRKNGQFIEADGRRDQGILDGISFGGDGATDAEKTQQREGEAFGGHGKFAIQARNGATDGGAKKWSVHPMGCLRLRVIPSDVGWGLYLLLSSSDALDSGGKFLNILLPENDIQPPADVVGKGSQFVQLP